MCGVAGFIRLRGSAPLAETVARMGKALVHRGPDDSGIWTDLQAGVALAHRRLSVIDLSAHGHQPMTSQCGRYILTYNGEIYNHEEIRQTLSRTCEVAWQGHSDTAVVLAAIAHWGIHRALSAFTGMFALAVWDRAARKLYLARDRMGEKPLYYTWRGDVFAFASEIHALEQHPGLNFDIRRDSIAQLMQWVYIPAPYTIYNHVYKLMPGEVLSLSVPSFEGQLPESAPRAPYQQPGLEVSSYWRLKESIDEAQSNPVETEEEGLHLIQDSLMASVRQQSIADVPIGCFLSGGVDSSLITALMQAQSSRPIHTFSIGFWEERFNEAPFAKAIAQHLGTAHTELYVTPEEVQDVIPRLPQLYSEPFADCSQVPTFLLSCLARQNVTVALSGDGGDELFGGYNRYFWTRRIWSKLSKLPAPCRDLLLKTLLALPAYHWDKVFACLPIGRRVLSGDRVHRVATQLAGVRDPSDLFFNLISFWPVDQVCVKGVTGPVDGDYRGRWPDEWSPELQMMYMDSLHYLADDILVKVDRAAMAVSLETRIPFLDKNVIHNAWRLPQHMKIRDGKGKWILKKLLRQHIPDALVDRPKQGFGIPLDSWLRGPLRDWAESLLEPTRLEQEGYFEPSVITKAWHLHLSGQRNLLSHIWPVLMFQAWQEQQKKGVVYESRVTREYNLESV